MMQFLWRYVDELIGKGLSLEILAQFFWYMGLMLMPQAFPLAILLSSLITFGNMGESSELTAIKAAGISLQWEEDEGSDYYLEMTIEKNDLTRQVHLCITDWCTPDEEESLRSFWEDSLERLHRASGM